MKIKKAKIEDADEIKKLRKESITKINGKDLNKKHIDFLLQMNCKYNTYKKIKKGIVYIARQNKKIIATIELNKNHISGFYVKNNLTKKGIGTKILNLIEKKAKKNGIKTIGLQCNNSSIEFYLKKGYKNYKTKYTKECGKNTPIFLVRKRL